MLGERTVKCNQYTAVVCHTIGILACLMLGAAQVDADSAPSGRAPSGRTPSGSTPSGSTPAGSSANAKNVVAATEPVAFAAAGQQTRLTDIQLRDCYGTRHTLGEWQDRKVLVLAFLGTECPLARLYGPRLHELAERFKDDDVQFVGVAPNIQDSLTEVQTYCRQSGITFPMLMDNEQRLTDAVGATRTPEVFVLNEAREVVYQGRIDDQYAISVARLKAGKEELAAAVESSLLGAMPQVSSTAAVGCLIGRRRQTPPSGDITYSKHIAPIFNARCVECHRSGQIAPFPLTTYSETIGWEAMIAEVVDQGRMPPWNANPRFGHFSNDARLTTEEKQLISQWITNGCPEGDPADLPQPPMFVDGWRMPQPDLVVNVSEQPFSVPATGVVEYQYIEVDPGFTEDKYIVAAEARPGNPAVVHHIIAFIKMPGQRGVSLGQMLIGYAPVTAPLVFAENTAMKVPAGARILFEMHYTPNGTAQTDISCIGLKFVDPSQVKFEVYGEQALNSRFEIPPNTADYEVPKSVTFKEDTELLSLTPHMHLRGKSFRYDATYPDGSTETLLDVPNYDFNWQLRYEFAKPKLIPAGTRINCVAVFDNSDKNPNNPSPDSAVRWGQQSWEEMMIGFFTCQRPFDAQASQGGQ